MEEDPESEHCKTVYAHAGLALYLSQCFEKGIENFLMLNSRVTGQCITLEQLDAFEESIEKRTLGRLLRDLKEHVDLKEGGADTLAEALQRRNFLAHRFFKERAEEFFSEAGRDRMVSELEKDQELLREADLKVSLICKALFRFLGISEEAIEEEYREIKEKAEANTAS